MPTSPPLAFHSVILSVSSYWFVSISMVFVNKALLSDPVHSINIPFFITFFQCLISLIGIYFFTFLRVSNVPKFNLTRHVLIQMLPLSIIFTLMITCNNVALKYVHISFYQVARSLTVPFNLFFDCLLLNHPPSPTAFIACLLVIFAFLLGNQQELNWSFPGVAFGVTASFFVALNAILLKRQFPLVDNNPWRLTLYNNLNAILLLTPFIFALGEPSILLTSSNRTSPNFWALMLAAGLLSIAISFAVAAQIKYTSPLTHNISATAKAAVQTVLGLIVYANPITVWGGVSVAIILLASLLYTLVRRADMAKRFEEDATVDMPDPDDKPDDIKPLLASSSPEGKESR